MLDPKMRNVVDSGKMTVADLKFSNWNFAVGPECQIARTSFCVGRE